MSDKVKLALTVEPDIDAAIRKYADKKGCTPGEALEKLVTTAVNRLNAVHKYAAAQAPAKPKAKKVKAKKAKGPLARKAKAAKSEAQATA